MSEYNRTDLTDENLRKIHSGSCGFVVFLFNAISVSIDLGLKLQFLCLPLDVKSLEIVSGVYSEKWGSKSSLNGWALKCQSFFICPTERVPFLFIFYIDDVIVRLKYYRLFRLKTTWGLNMNIVWHVSMNFTDTIMIFFVCLLWLRLSLWINEENENKRGFWI